MDSDHGVSVAPLREQRQLEGEGRSAVALDHDGGAGRQHIVQCA
jgi:hypothetical protein